MTSAVAPLLLNRLQLVNSEGDASAKTNITSNNANANETLSQPQ